MVGPDLARQRADNDSRDPYYVFLPLKDCRNRFAAAAEQRDADTGVAVGIGVELTASPRLPCQKIYRIYLTAQASVNGFPEQMFGAK